MGLKWTSSMALNGLARLARKTGAASPSLPSGLRVYAVGDIHGRLDLLDNLAEQIRADLVSAPPEVMTIFLGDYVDRGPASAGVLDRLSRGDFPTPIHALRGNHEDVVMRFLDDETVLDDWRGFGGIETLQSYGVDVMDAVRRGGYGLARKTLLARMPREHRLFLEQTRFAASLGDYFFCHAGVRPGVALESQKPRDLLWIREDFLRHKGAWSQIIVHGHTPVPRPEVLPNRINLDTGAFASSILTALVLEGSERRFLSTENAPRLFQSELNR
jgi:serine/threonine protein phosphatase 1